MRAPLLAALLVTLLAVPAAVADAPSSLTGDLDGDGVDETMTTQTGCVPPATAPPCAMQASVTVTDTCPSGSTAQAVVAKITGSDPHVDSLQLVDADGLPGKEMFIDLRPQVTISNRENLRLVAWRAQSGEPCAQPKTLWSVLRPGKPPYRGAKYSGFGAGLVDVTKKYPGFEVALVEYFAERGHPRTKPNVERRTLFRYSDATGVYVRYYRRVVHVRPRTIGSG